ncbi:replication licensing factor Cdt1 [Blomia tropicalis]|nr:replication licensing factor Cdt1 [Blomia tropicalis]
MESITPNMQQKQMTDFFNANSRSKGKNSSALSSKLLDSSVDKSKVIEENTPNKRKRSNDVAGSGSKRIKSSGKLKMPPRSNPQSAVSKISFGPLSVLSPVKSTYQTLSPRKVRNPEKFSLSGLSMIPSPLKATTTVAPSTPSKLLQSPYLANCINSPRAKERLSCSRRLFEDDEKSQNDEDINESSSSSIIPAYKRFAHLTSSKQSEDQEHVKPLTLPTKFKKLSETFKQVDYIALCYKKRQEVLTFDKLKQKVEISTRRTFDLTTLTKILTVILGGNYRWFKLEYQVIDKKNQLTITPHYSEHVKSIHSINVLLEREKQFYDLLLELTKREHVQFLAKMNLQLTPSSIIYNWHPMFKLDMVDDIVPDENILPKKKSNIKFVDNPNSILNYCIRREPLTKTEVGIKLDNNNHEDESEDKSLKAETKKVERSQGIPLHLLKKVREKEAATKARLMFRSPEIDRELSQLSRLPAIIRIIDRYFQSTKAKSHSYEQIIKKLSESMKCSLLMAEKSLDYLISLKLLSSDDDNNNSREWLRSERVSNTNYLLIDTNFKMNFLFKQINARLYVWDLY